MIFLHMKLSKRPNHKFGNRFMNVLKCNWHSTFYIQANRLTAILVLILNNALVDSHLADFEIGYVKDILTTISTSAIVIVETIIYPGYSRLRYALIDAG